jgi:hypothetical protein
MDFSVRHPSSPNTYSYVQGEILGLTRNFVENYIVCCLCVLPTELLHYHTPAVLERGWRNQVPPAHMQQV